MSTFSFGASQKLFCRHFEATERRLEGSHPCRRGEDGTKEPFLSQILGRRDPR